MEDLKQAAEKALAALEDLVAGWKYIRSSHGELYGVGWDRAQGKGDSAIESLRAALFTHPAPVAAAPEGWQPIETAPKDGTWVLCFRYLDDKPDVASAFWKPDRGAFGGAFWTYAALDNAPTHWMPLPAAPSASPAPQPVAAEPAPVLMGHDDEHSHGAMAVAAACYCLTPTNGRMAEG
ncbi:hypothetical protein [Bacteriophage sp.]|nr:hypothetical protein [Bacteriophage sp.]